MQNSFFEILKLRFLLLFFTVAAILFPNEIFSQEANNENFIRAVELHTAKDFKASSELFESLKKSYEKFKNWEKVVNCLNYLATNESYQGAYEKSHLIADEAISIYFNKDVQQDSLVANCFDLKGENWLRVGELDSARFYYKKAIPLYKELENWYRLSYSTIGLAVCYFHTRQIDSMEYSLDYTNSIVDEYMPNNEELLPIIFNLKSALYNLNGDFDKAIQTAEKATVIWSALEENGQLIIGYNNLGV